MSFLLFVGYLRSSSNPRNYKQEIVSILGQQRKYKHTSIFLWLEKLGILPLKDVISVVFEYIIWNPGDGCVNAPLAGAAGCFKWL